MTSCACTIAAAARRPAASVPCQVYTVQAGDTLETIGQQFGFTVGERARPQQPARCLLAPAQGDPPLLAARPWVQLPITSLLGRKLPFR